MNCDSASYANLPKSEVLRLADRQAECIRRKRKELHNKLIDDNIARREKYNKSLLGRFFPRSTDRDDVEHAIEFGSPMSIGFYWQDNFAREIMQICEDLVCICSLTASESIHISTRHLRAITMPASDDID